MKKMCILPALIAGLTFCLEACGDQGRESKNQQVITEKIEYPVFIKSPYDDESGDWWKENIETSKRLEFVEILFDWAYAGKVQAFDYLTNKPLSAEEVKKIGNESDTIRVNDKNPPYDEKDTVIQNKLDLRQIHKLKFLEEWCFNKDDHSITKKVLGVAPALTVYTDSSEVLGQRPLFWIYFDKAFIASLEKKK
jgi:hypothetical protein